MRFINPTLTDGSGKEYPALVPHAVISGCFPEWLKQRVLQKFPAERSTKHLWADRRIGELSREGGSDRWLDHWGIANYGGKQFLASEPYSLEDSEIQALQRFCRTLNLEYVIQAFSHHYPTRTFRIMIWPKDWNIPPNLLEDLSNYQTRSSGN